MGTLLVFGAALLFFGSLATASNDEITLRTATTLVSSTTTQATLLNPDTASTGSKKLKRGVVEVGTKIWANQGKLQTKIINPTTSYGTTRQNGDSYSPQSTSSSTSYSPAKNYDRKAAYNNQNSGYHQPTSYSSTPVFINSGGSQGNVGQIQGSTAGLNYKNAGQSYVTSPQSYTSNDQSQNSGLTTYYVPQNKFVSAQDSPKFVTNFAPTQNSQNGQIQNGGANTPYFTTFSTASNPTKSYEDKLPAESFKTTLVQQTPYQQQQNTQKTQQSMYAPEHQSAPFIIGGIGSFPYQQTASLNQNQGFPYVSQSSPVFSGTSQVQKNALKTNYPEQISPEFAQMYAPYHQSASSFVSNVQDNGLGAATVDFNGKKIPLPVLQLQSAQDFPGFAQAIQSQPLVLETSLPYQGQPEFSFLADFTKGLSPGAGNVLPFLNPQQSNQPQVLPVRSANGSPQFPQYKGASLNTSPDYNLGRPPTSYEPLKTQPQLHFTAKPAQPPAPSTGSIIHHPSLSSRPSAEIRDDVEVIKKKKPPPPPSHDFDEDEDEGYKTIEREYGRGNADDTEDDEPKRGKYFKESDSESDFKPSKSFPFKLYDEKFSKYSKPSDDDSEEDGPSSRYRHHSSSDDEDDYDGHSSTHQADYRAPKARPSRNEDNDEESQRYERPDEAEKDEEHERKPSAYSSYGKDFEQEFEDSYRRDLPKNKYAHVKEVPEIDEPGTTSHKSHSSSDSPSKYSSKGRRGYHQSHDEEPEESKSYGSQSSQKYRKSPKNGDNEGYSSHIRSYNKSPKVVHEESFGYRVPDGESHSKYKKSPAGDSYSSVKKSPKMDSYLQASRSSYKSPKNDKAYEKGDSYSYSTGGSWKSDKKSPETSDHYGHASSHVRTLVQPDSQFNFYAPATGRGNFYSKGIKTVRDLTGI